MDDFDRATEREMQHRELSIKQARAKNQPIKFTGRCLYCNAEIETGRYCDYYCKEDAEMEATIKGRQFR